MRRWHLGSTLRMLIIFATVSFQPGLASSERSELVVRFGSFSKAVDYAPYLVAKKKRLFEATLKRYNAYPTFQEFQTFHPLMKLLPQMRSMLYLKPNHRVLLGAQQELT